MYFVTVMGEMYSIVIMHMIITALDKVPYPNRIGRHVDRDCIWRLGRGLSRGRWLGIWLGRGLGSGAGVGWEGCAKKRAREQYRGGRGRGSGIGIGIGIRLG